MRSGVLQKLRTLTYNPPSLRFIRLHSEIEECSHAQKQEYEHAHNARHAVVRVNNFAVHK